MASFAMIFLTAFVAFCAGAWALLALLRWLAADRPRWVPEEREWQRIWYRLDPGRVLRLPAFPGGVLAVLACATIVIPPWSPHGFWAALGLSILAGWHNPGHLGRYVMGFVLALISVMQLLALGKGGSVLGGLFAAPFLIKYLLPIGAGAYMAGAVVRRIASSD